MKKLYLLFFTCFILYNALPVTLLAQCGSLAATAISYESRCKATGSIKVSATGGSGNYKYKASGPVNTNFTSTDSITGLAAGNYTITVTDIASNCSINISNVRVQGSYLDPRFTLNSVDVTCDNGANGSISLATQHSGRAPFSYSIIAPSPMGVGTTSATGTFTGLSAGIYTIRLTDSCGGIQTRLVTINNYTWRIDSVRFTKFSCDSARGYIRVSDNRGNVSTINNLPGFIYGIVRSAGDTIWSGEPAFSFYLGSQNTFDAVVKDPCGRVRRFNVAVSFNVTVNNTVSTYNYSCKQFSASITGVTNFFNPRFCLLDANGVEIACNTTGVFNNINYGSYCITAHDSCTDTIITRCFTRMPMPASVANEVYISNKVCADFTASITGQSGLTNPEYCLYDSLNNLVSCNTTGVFNNLSYGSYCINIADTCRDTTMQRCFSVRRPVPVVPPVIPPSYYGCNYFGLAVTGDSLTNPLFCLRDTSGNIIICNNTGVFDSIAYGNYCISVYDSCADTTIIRCIGVDGPTVTHSYTSEITNRACSTFTATVFNSSFLGPQYCLYRADSTLVACNSNGIFDSLAYGEYYVVAHNTCPDTSFVYPLSAYPAIPSLNGWVSISNRACSTFNASLSGQQNFTNPQYCLYDSANVLIACNTSGEFQNIVYGNYCIAIKDGCYDTTINRCFSAEPLPLGLHIASSKSCNYGYSVLAISIWDGVAPFSVSVYNPDGSVFSTGTYPGNSISIDSVPELAPGERYTIIATDNCGSADTDSIMPNASKVFHQARVLPKCPSSTWVNGSGSIETTSSSNTATISTRIIKKNNAIIPAIAPSNIVGAVSTFNNLGPGTYIVRYRINDVCGIFLYDTVVVPEYQYPTLERSSAYQCDAGGFSIGAVVSNGVGPFLYEIIASTPATPSIIAAPQANPVFTIDNGASYSLVRLRAVDACGNASLEDASILPLANNGIISDFNCFQLYTTLRVDTLYNSSYAWYRKHTVNDTDSTFVTNAHSIYFPSVMPEDTGLYVCHINVNTGCIKRTYYYRLDGSCFSYLPVSITGLEGNFNRGHVRLNWKMAGNTDVKTFVVEKKKEGGFKQIGRVDVPVDPVAETVYHFKDSLAGYSHNYYRIKIIRYNNTVAYSNVIEVNGQKPPPGIAIYPNPANRIVTVELPKGINHQYAIQLLDPTGKSVRALNVRSGNNNKVTLEKPYDGMGGLYFVRIYNVTTQEYYMQKVLFK